MVKLTLIVSFKWDLRSNIRTCSYDIFLLILWRKNFVHNFWLVITKLWSYFSVSDVIATKVQEMSPGFLFIIL